MSIFLFIFGIVFGRPPPAFLRIWVSFQGAFWGHFHILLQMLRNSKNATLLSEMLDLGVERCRGTWEHTEGDLRGPGLDFYRFWKDFGAAIWTFLANFGTTIVFFGMRVCRSRFLNILGSESGCLGLQNQAFGVEGIAKTSFSHMSGLCRFWCHLYMVFNGSGTDFDDFSG